MSSTRRTMLSTCGAALALTGLLGATAMVPASAQEGAAAPPEATAVVSTPAPTPEPTPAPTSSTPAADAGTIAAPTPAATPAPTKRRTTRTTRRRSVAVASKLVPRGGTSVEVDISSQRMHIYKGGKLYRSVAVSTGSGRRYCSGGSCAIAHTPRGRFRVYNRISGWRTAKLGRLYNPLYFRGGFAIHGGNLPGYPASHGCVRVSMSVARWLPSVVPNGASVWIHD